MRLFVLITVIIEIITILPLSTNGLPGTAPKDANQAPPLPEFRGASPGSINVPILKQTSDVNPDGSYQWSYETQNGIKAQEEGHPSNLPEGPVVATGSFQYAAPDNTPVSLKYVADENGFHPQGDHIPPQLARALEWLAAHPEPN